MQFKHLATLLLAILCLEAMLEALAHQLCRNISPQAPFATASALSIMCLYAYNRLCSCMQQSHLLRLRCSDLNGVTHFCCVTLHTFVVWHYTLLLRGITHVCCVALHTFVVYLIYISHHAYTCGLYGYLYIYIT